MQKDVAQDAGSAFIRIDKDSDLPIIEQIINNITSCILSGRLHVGEKLPAERVLAGQLGVARGTVQRAYARLAQERVVELRKGSGVYVLTDEERLGIDKKQQAADILASTLSRLQEMGLTEKEIQSLLDLHRVSVGNVRKVNIMVVSNNYEVLAELQKQLAYLSGTPLFTFTLSYFPMEHILGSADPVELLYPYDLIIATSIDYPDICKPAPMYIDKMMEATIQPTTDTLITLSEIANDSRVSVVYRTRAFLDMVTETLTMLGFARENILDCQEYAYNPRSHAEHGVSTVITFNECLIHLNPAFHERNADFLKNGGRMVSFRYRIDRASLIQIEDRIRTRMAAGKP